MTLPANIRINTQANFPALVYGTGPIAISKANGIWTVGFSIASLALQVPTSGSWPTDQLIVWDDVNKTFFKMTITALISSLAIITGQTRTQRIVTTTPITVGPADQIINCNIPTPAAATLPSAASRAGIPLTFQDLGNAAANHITLTAAGGDSIDGLTTAVMANNYQAITLIPLNDGTSTGWVIA